MYVSPSLLCGVSLVDVHVPSLSHSPTAESFGVSAQIGSGVVRGGPEVRFHEGSTKVPPSARAAGWCEHYKEHRMLLGISPELIFLSSVLGWCGHWDENSTFSHKG